MRPRAIPPLILLTLLAADIPATDTKPLPLFTGKDLTGWTVTDTSRADLWSVAQTVTLDPKNPKQLIPTGQPNNDKGLLVARLNQPPILPGAHKLQLRAHPIGRYHR